MLHAAFVRSDDRRAPRSRSIDTSAATALPGVVAVFTWQDFDGRSARRGTRCSARSCRSRRRSRSATCATSATRWPSSIAESRYVAEDACELIEVDYEPQPAVVDYRHGRRRHRATWCTAAGACSRTRWWRAVHADVGRPRRGVRRRRARRGVHDRAEPLHLRADGDAGASSPRGTPGATRSTIVCRDAERARDPQLLRAAISTSPRATSRVVARDVGGGFGQKMFVLPRGVRGRRSPPRCSAGR